MARRGEKFLLGLAKSLGGSARARVQAIIEYDRQQKEEQARERQAKLDALNERYTNARIADLAETKQRNPVKLEHGFAPDGTEYWYNPETGETKYGNKFHKSESDKGDKVVAHSLPGGGISYSGPANLVGREMIDRGIPFNVKPKEEKVAKMTPYQMANLRAKAGDLASFAKYESGTPNPAYGKSDSLLTSWMGPQSNPEVAPVSDIATSVFGNHPTQQVEVKPSAYATPGNTLSQKADELVRQGKMTPEEREQYRQETGN
jgi:hypothetical protein